MPRPRIAIVGRFTQSASALRYRGVVSSRALLEGVWAAGGDPVTLLPGSDPDAVDWPARLAGVDGVLLPGGGDLDPARYGADPEHPDVYDVDPVQDDADISLAEYVLSAGIPMLAVCRGMHVVNVVRGGTLVVHLENPHRHVVQSIDVSEARTDLNLSTDHLDISCYHHQAIDVPGTGIVPTAHAADGTIEAIRVESSNGSWCMGVQWHPEDTFTTDPHQVEVLRALVERARQHAVTR